MTKLYFLDGLGSNRYYASDLIAALEQDDHQVIYLPLPGHPDNQLTTIRQAQDVINWLDDVLPEQPTILLGYSLGADFAAAYAYARPERVVSLLLLDGACHDLTAYPESQELSDAQTYLSTQVFENMAEHLAQVKVEHPNWSENLQRAEQVAYIQDIETGIYHLNLIEETILELLKARRQFGYPLKAIDFDVPTRVLISDQPESVYTDKIQFLSQCRPTVRYEVIPNSSHSFYIDKPKEIADRLTKALEDLSCANT